jgi:hypothetical protein
MRRPIGLDLNGWHDFACRDWSAEDIDNHAGETSRLDGGIRSVVVSQEELVVGGPQALLSPIGRGQGWSDIGDPANRRLVADHWSELLAGRVNERFNADMFAAAQALSPRADQIVVCIPDRPDMNEAAQSSLRNALVRRRSPRPFLLWRSVALVLGLLDADELPGATEGTRIECLIHAADGIEQQSLVLRRDSGHAGRLTPERAGTGGMTCARFGLNGLLDLAKRAVDLANPWISGIPAEPADMPNRILFDEGPLQPDEIIRRDNGNWIKLKTPECFSLPTPTDLPEISADLILLLSPLALRHRCAINALLAERNEAARVVMVSPDTAARGALYAARRIERGIPHYFDRLDQVSLLVMRGPEPVFLDLVPPGAMAPGNREYVSTPFTRLEWPAGLSEPSFLIRKGGHEIRKLMVTGRSAPARSERLELRLRQTPAQGWARLSLSAVAWNALRDSPIEIDWNVLEVETRSEEEVVDQHRPPRPAVPHRFVISSELGLWDGSLQHPGLAQLLDEYDPAIQESLKRLVTLVRSPSRGPQGGRFAALRHAVSSDGVLPDGLSQKTINKFHDIIRIIGSICMKVANSDDTKLQNNDALMFLTWIFSQCPIEVQDELIGALRCEAQGEHHPFLAPTMAWRVVRYGVGRALGERDALAPFVIELFDLLPCQSAIPPLSVILSRSRLVPEILAKNDARLDEFAEKVAISVRGLLETAKLSSTYSEILKITTGLLRIRELRPWALMTESSIGAKILLKIFYQAVEYMEISSNNNKIYKKKIELTRNLMEFLETGGGNIYILNMIESDEENSH